MRPYRLREFSWFWDASTAGHSRKEANIYLSREWFAITAFPLIAGTFGPIASALNICALVSPWKCRPALGSQSEDEGINLPDPGWLIGINTISLLFGVIANSTNFLINDRHGFLGKHRLFFTLTTSVGGIIASLILVALIVAARLTPIQPPNTNYRFTQAYYYAILSACVYFVTSLFVIYTAYRLSTTDRWRKTHKILRTKGHHRLMAGTVLFMAYILAGAAVFSHVEGWRYLDSVYWVDVTVLTIGFGDFAPVTHLGRSLFFPYAAGGDTILIFIIYCITELVLKRGKSVWEIHIRDKELNKEVQKRKDEKENEMEAKKVASFARYWKDKVKGGGIETSTRNRHVNQAADELMSNSKKFQHRKERDSRKKSFERMQGVLLTAARKRLWYSVGIWGISWISLWLIGAAVFWAFEHSQKWTYFEAVYFSLLTLLTIGYGDLVVQNNISKAFFVLWSLIAIPTITMLITSIAKAVGNPYVKEKKKHWFTTLVDDSEKKTSEQLHNKHDKNHLLARAIRKLIDHHIQNQRKFNHLKYTFEDWEYVFFLMDVPEPSYSRDEQTQTIDDDSIRLEVSRSSIEEWEMDWLDENNPLYHPEKVTEWMLLRLVEKLEAELRQLRKENGILPIGD